MNSTVLVAIIIGVFGLPATITAFYLGIKQSKTQEKISQNTQLIEKTKAEAENKAEIVKSEFLTKAENIKTATEAETKRVDQLLDSSMELIKNLQEENRQQRKEMMGMDKTQRQELLSIRTELNTLQQQMSACVVASGEFKRKMEENEALYNTAVAQMHNVADYYETTGVKGPTIYEDVRIDGKMTKKPKPKKQKGV